MRATAIKGMSKADPEAILSEEDNTVRRVTARAARGTITENTTRLSSFNEKYLGLLPSKTTFHSVPFVVKRKRIMLSSFGDGLLGSWLPYIWTLEVSL